MEKNILSVQWEITAEESKKKINAGLFIVGPLIIISFIGLMTSWHGNDRVDMNSIVYASIGMTITFILAFLVNVFIRYKDRRYLLDDHGVTINNGGKQQFYAWEEFDSYYNYSERSKKNIVGNTQLRQYDANSAVKINKIEGDIFYLKQKTKNPLLKMFKFFVVVYGTIDNSHDVDIILARFLAKREMKNCTDLGLVFYKYK